MSRELVVSIYAVIATMSVLAIGFMFPPIISRDGWISPSADAASVSDQELALTQQEHAFCRENLDDVNCACFARKAGHILAQPQPELFGYTYTDRSELARGRAKHTC